MLRSLQTVHQKPMSPTKYYPKETVKTLSQQEQEAFDIFLLSNQDRNRIDQYYKLLEEKYKSLKKEMSKIDDCKREILQVRQSELNYVENHRMNDILMYYQSTYRTSLNNLKILKNEIESLKSQLRKTQINIVESFQNWYYNQDDGKKIVKEGGDISPIIQEGGNNVINNESGDYIIKNIYADEESSNLQKIDEELWQLHRMRKLLHPNSQPAMPLKLFNLQNKSYLTRPSTTSASMRTMNFSRESILNSDMPFEKSIPAMNDDLLQFQCYEIINSPCHLSDLSSRFSMNKENSYGIQTNDENMPKLRTTPKTLPDKKDISKKDNQLEIKQLFQKKTFNQEAIKHSELLQTMDNNFNLKIPQLKEDNGKLICTINDDNDRLKTHQLLNVSNEDVAFVEFIKNIPLTGDADVDDEIVQFYRTKFKTQKC